ncbi:unnamed protein product [Clonostachys solani]|uniref:U3 small nucleolar RNA-associated protein 17 n=1 Tax=Clonostachys solani TaxID=160281 RepID=A0A9N9ZJI2_9HYPO|nr:unnamed protein product [Clonostachys solani]
MAGSKSQKSLDDSNKKRKRDTGEFDLKTKRHRKDEKNGTSKAKAQGEVSENDGQLQSIATSNRGSESKILAKNNLSLIQQTEDGEAGWRVSKPMGGRMLDIDPILTADEQYIILTYNTSIQVYSASTSLLIRRISISTLESQSENPTSPPTITATRLSLLNPDFVWVGCSDGRIFFVNWTQASRPKQKFQTKSATAKALATVLIGPSKKVREAVLIVESDKQNRLDITAYLGPEESKHILNLKKNGFGLQLLESYENGKILVGAINDRLFIGTISSGQIETLAQLSFEFFSFDTPDLITCLDTKITSQKSGSESRVNILVGGARGAIHLYHDALSRLQAITKSKSEKDTIQAQKYHWHRKAVHSVKWSHDGNYMISGGSENVLALWQMDTSKKDFLPHLSGSVENIVVSQSGSSYVVHLDDNSAMILSTAEMKPTAYVSGLQSASAYVSIPKDLLVQRVWSAPEQVQRPIPAAIRPTEPSKLHVCVGNGRQAAMSGEFSAPLLQSFDLESFTSANRQPLARTQPTDVNITNKGNPIDEPLITHISFSADGRWLASVDEWKPAERDVDNVSNDQRNQFIRERYEVYLKFWEVGASDDSAALVSRINAPHATNQPESVLDLAANPVSSSFATIGSDGMVRVWRPKVRQQNGIVAKSANGKDAYTWSCSQVIPVGEVFGQDASVDLVNATSISEPQGAIAFSEDGSTIFAAFQSTDSGVVYVIDAASGEVVKTLEGLWNGRMRSIKALGTFLIVLSDQLRVYDVVGDELRYGIEIPTGGPESSLLNMAVDQASGHFILAVPAGAYSRIGVFDPEQSEPLLVRNLPHRIVSLVSAPNQSGFVAVDDAAQVWTISEGSDPSSLAVVQPLDDLRLDEGSESVNVPDETNDEPQSEDEDEQEKADQDVEMEDDDDDTYSSVVVSQHLADIFDAAPAFAAPSIEDMFYKVTGLLAAKPLVAEQR